MNTQSEIAASSLKMFMTSLRKCPLYKVITALFMTFLMRNLLFDVMKSICHIIDHGMDHYILETETKQDNSVFSL